MHSQGHKGIALLLYSPITYFLLETGRPIFAIGGLVLVLMLSMVPDKDMVIPLLRHRGPTHTIWFAGVVGAVLAGVGIVIQFGLDQIGIVAVAVPVTGLFIVGFLSIVYHIIGDALNPSGVRPYKPISSHKHALGVTKSGSFLGNWFFYILGFVANLVAVALGLQGLLM
ncbi:metal-dependent hydrolase [Halorussus marinus]|uniref:metal-dependent hydrolase n=1 Tax=Halorussus marinus TaxID=2505976 RepID=UPI0014308A0C|nr:metal-dependent hydrolase [Halorussus marinus]